MSRFALLFAGLAGLGEASAVVAVPRATSWESRARQCQKFSEIYSDGEDLAHTMWGNAFKYVSPDSPEYDKAYDMWFQPGSEVNPNAATVSANVAAGFLHEAYGDSEHSEQCHFEYAHRDTPQAMESQNHECSPWQKSSCCLVEVMASAQKINKLYDGYHWDRCGPLSYECETFFVQEACFYECEPSAAYYRKFQPHSVVGADHPDAFNASNEGHNEWKMEGMPVKGDYFDRWLQACSNDMFCGVGGGNFFDCAETYKDQNLTDLSNKLFSERKKAEEEQAAAAAAAAAAAEQAAADAAEELKAAKAGQDQPMQDEGLSEGATNAIVVAACVAFLALLALLVLVYKERSGNPVFTKMSSGPAAGKAKDLQANTELASV